jgi:hypothetical protein
MFALSPKLIGYVYKKTLETTLAPPKLAEVGSYFGRSKVYLWIVQSFSFQRCCHCGITSSYTNATSFSHEHPRHGRRFLAHHQRSCCCHYFSATRL